MSTCPEGYTLFEGQSDSLKAFTELISFNTYGVSDKFALLYRRVGARQLRVLLYCVYDSDSIDVGRYFLCGFDIYYPRDAMSTLPDVRNVNVNPVLVYMYLHTEGESLGDLTPLVSRMLPSIVHHAVGALITRNGAAIQRMFRISDSLKDSTANAASAEVLAYLEEAIPVTRTRTVAQRNESQVYGNVYNRKKGTSTDILILLAVTTISTAAAIFTYKAIVSK